ncbi:MAG: DUF29 domain-containing protein [Rhizobiaceae bacterium]|nr:DUF29 domain-containing protein [Rhizobiaceae bacterium]
MNRHFPKAQLTPYEADYALWCAEQGALLREGRLSDLDRRNLAEEIESLGRRDKDEIESRLNVLLVHLLKWKYQPEGRTGSWEGSIVEQRYRLARRLAESPSLRNYPASILDDEYVSARLKASGETGLPRGTFPEVCPFAIEQALDPSFLPEAR